MRSLVLVRLFVRLCDRSLAYSSVRLLVSVLVRVYPLIDSLACLIVGMFVGSHVHSFDCLLVFVCACFVCLCVRLCVWLFGYRSFVRLSDH